MKHTGSAPQPVLSGLAARCACSLILLGLPLIQSQAAPYQGINDIVQASAPSDWRTPDPQNLLYMELPSGRVIIELAPSFAPQHVNNVRALAREQYFDGLSINRAQDNYVVQWGDPEDPHRRPVRRAKARLPAEFSRRSEGLAFDVLAEKDVYAPEVGFSGGFPAARDTAQGEIWLAHCYGMVGAGRDDDADSGGGTELYAIIGHAPRHLDRNVTLLGRVLRGMEYLSSLPRGTGEMGFYESPTQRMPIRSIRVAADVDVAQRTNVEVMRTDTATFARVVESRRNRRDAWTKVPAGHIELCNVPLPVRLKPGASVPATDPRAPIR
jgi:peptidylprolyl isomerase